MKFKGDIIIADPLFLAKGNDWGETFDWNTNTIKSDIFSTYFWGDANSCFNEFNMFSTNKKIVKESILTNYFNEFIDCMTPEDVDEFLEKNDFWEEDSTLYVDSASFGVFYLEEALKYNPDINLSNMITVKDFDGKIIVKKVCADELRLLGLGNKVFFIA